MSQNLELSVSEVSKPAFTLPASIQGLVNVMLLSLVAEAIWYLVFSPEGPTRLYTPNVGLSLVVTILMVIHWGVDVLEFWPFSAESLQKMHPLVKGPILSILYVGAGAVVMFGIYHSIIGPFGALFFSGPALIASGGLGQYSQTAIENGCYAQIVMNTSIIFFTMLWLRCLGFTPWEGLDRPARGFSVWIAGLLLGIIAFSLLFYPHIAYQFYPQQIFMAAAPWWSGAAMTQSSLFHFGWIVPALVLLYWTRMLWEGYPFILVHKPWLRGVMTALVSIGAGIGLMFLSNSIMDWYFGAEAFEGGSMTEQPAWRWNHVAEMAMFMQLAAAILFHYFDNWPNRLSLPLRAIVRTAIAVTGGLLIAKLYYELAPDLLGTVPGIAQEADTTLCWTVLVLILITMHALFFDCYPFRRRKKD
ncbi:MAG: hypothetical protein GX423_01780 [Nitrospiraceae bacterium]|nr:hypothetical protein [Nitrospiraceae bacterium]